jgi:hypothetical protein
MVVKATAENTEWKISDDASVEDNNYVIGNCGAAL